MVAVSDRSLRLIGHAAVQRTFWSDTWVDRSVVLASIAEWLRRRQPSLTHVIDRLEQEHHVIAEVLEQVDEALAGVVGGDGYGAAGREALDELQRTVDLLTDTLLSHLSYEERELVHPLAQHGFG